MTEFDEDYVKFIFDDQWTMLKYDNENFYRKEIQCLPGTKAVDFIGLRSSDGQLFLIEIKDFRIKHPDSIDELFNDVGSKCRDTIAGIMGTVRASNESKWSAFSRNVGAKNKELRIVLVFERRNGTGKDKLSFLTEKLKSKLSWLTPKVFVTSLDTLGRNLPGVTFKNLPGAGQL